MIFKFNSRLLVQTSKQRAIYSIPVVSATTHSELPFFVPQMDIEILSQRGATDFIAPIRFDDIVRFQVSVQFSDYEKVVWQDLFGGRIQTPDVQFQNGKNTAKLRCVGHSDEARTKLIEHPFTFSTDNIIENVFVTNMGINADRLCYDPVLSAENKLPENLDLSDYQIKANQKYLMDFFQDIEKETAYSWKFTQRPRYNAYGILVTPTIIDFLPIRGAAPIPPTGTVYTNQFGDAWTVNVGGGVVSSIWVNGVVTGKTSGTFILNNLDTITLVYTTAPDWTWTPVTYHGYKIIEGTPRLLSADFLAKGDLVYNRAIEQGTSPFVGTGDNLTSQGLYGIRVFSETDNGLGSNAMCSKFAAGITSHFGYPIPAGQVILQLTPDAQVGDYVQVIIPSIDLNGSSISNYFTVTKVQHDISAGKAITTLDLGYTIATPEEYLLRFAKLAHLAMKNFI